MTTRGPNNIFSGEPLPLVPNFTDPETAAFTRNLIDYLRRLTGKLSRFSSSGSGGELVFSACLSTDQILGDGIGGGAAVKWTQTLRKDSAFQVNTPFDIIRVLTTGFYVVEVDFLLKKRYPPTVAIVTKNGLALSYGVTKPFVDAFDSSASLMVPVNLSANDELGIVISGIDELDKTGTRLLVTKIGDET